MLRQISTILVVLVFAATPVTAEVYKKIGANGVPTYSNKRTRGATRVKATSYIYSYRPSYARRVPSKKKKEYSAIAERVANKYGVDPDLVKAVIAVESGYDANAVSPKGAQGLMQLMPFTADRFGVEDAFQPEQNIEGGVKYLRWLHDEFGGNVIFVLASYNAGENIVKKLKAIPPYAETRNYVRKVLALKDNREPDITGYLARKTLYTYVDKNGMTHLTDRKTKGSRVVR